MSFTPSTNGDRLGDRSVPLTNSLKPMPQNRRLRLMGLARAARDTYIPKLTTSVTLLASGVTGRSIEHDAFGLPLVFPKGTTFTLFPSYCRPVAHSEEGPGYIVSVRGRMWCPGVMSRKNRLILSLAKQITKYGSGSAAAAAVETVHRLENDPALRQDSLLETDQTASEVSSIYSDGTYETTATAASGGSAKSGLDDDKLIKERLSSFIARSIPRAGLNVIVGAADPSKTSHFEETQIMTDTNGNFEEEIFVSYEPSVVQVSAESDETICSFQDVRIVSVSGYGLISDIDDTVKLTGVIGDKRELMHRLLLGDVMSWKIPPVIAWYKALLSRSDFTFHYVSNSPWQLLSLISQYFDAVQLPPGSMHLKQYTGNIISSLMEPSSSRKKKSLFKIAGDFPEKKFICVGDSGERDWEAYADLAASHPGQVKSIYIRVVPESLSDVDDSNILSEINRMIEEWSRRQKAMPQIPKSDSERDLIDLSDTKPDAASTAQAAKLPPLIPKKPTSLKGVTITKAPPLPERKYLQKAAIDANLEHHHEELPTIKPTSPVPRLSSASSRASSSASTPPPPPPPRRNTTTSSLSSPPLNNNSLVDSENFHVHNLNGAESFYELEDVDKRGAEWLQRVTLVLHELEGTGTKLHFFRDSDDQFFTDSLQDLD